MDDGLKTRDIEYLNIETWLCPPSIFLATCLPTHDFVHMQPVEDPDQAFGGQSNKGALKSLQLFKIPSLRQSLGITQKWLPFLGQENV